MILVDSAFDSKINSTKQLKEYFRLIKQKKLFAEVSGNDKLWKVIEVALGPACITKLELC